MFCFCRFQNRIPLPLCGSFAKLGIKRDIVPRLLFIFQKAVIIRLLSIIYMFQRAVMPKLFSIMLIIPLSLKPK